MSDYAENDIAVVGMSVNVAGAEDVGQFWDLMLQAKSQHVEVPAHRFTFKSTAWRPVDPNRKWYGNFIDDYDAFDHKFFKKTPREALYADPQQRLFLQCAYQAVEQSGYFNLANPDKKVGVYVGVGSAEYEANFACHQTNAFSATGNLKSAIAGRVSHFFGWTGPGLAVDTACSASSVAMHLACRAIASGDCNAAVVGGTQMLTSPFHFQNLAGASFLSPTGPCKPFDIRADGYCRGEGIGAVFVKKMSHALRDGDNILGCIASTAVLQNDSSTPMFAPNADSLAALLDTVITSAKLSPADIDAVEAHGTGTRVGDPAEFESIRRILGRSPGRTEPLPVSSVKSLVGHTECASGLVSLVKSLLMLHHGVVPMQVGFQELNPELGHSDQDLIEIPLQRRIWQPGFRAALINSFGASGSNSAMVVTKIPASAPKSSRITRCNPFWITGMDTRSLVAYAMKLANFVERSDASIADIAYNVSKQSNRTLPQSIVFQVDERDELIAKLRDFVNGGHMLEARTVKKPRPVILCFGGQTSMTVGLSRQLFDRSLLLRKHLDDCEEILSRHNIGSLYPAIFQREPLHDTVQLQIALFALQYACARVWMDCGIQVAAVVGHSFGELVCLTISGCASLEDTISAVHTRAVLVRDKFGPDPGAMIAVDGNLDDVTALLRASRGASVNHGAVEIACYNGPTSFTLAGPTSAIDAVVAVLPQFKNLKSKRLSVSNAFHSCLVDPLIPDLREVSKTMALGQPQILWERACNQADDNTLTREFFALQMRKPVHAHSAFERLHARFPSAVWLEAGSGSTITKIAKKALGAPKSSYFQSINICNDETGIFDMVGAVEQLWREGINVRYWLHHSLHSREYETLLLPPYQFEKSRHWLELKDPETVVVPSATKEPARIAAPAIGLVSFAAYLDSDKRSACYQINTTAEQFKNAVCGRVIPGDSEPICSLTLAVAVAIEAHNAFTPEINWREVEHEARNVTTHTPLTLSEVRKNWITIQPLDLSRLDAWQWVIYSTDHLDNGHTVHFEGELLITASHELTTYQRLVQHKPYHDLSTCNDPDDSIQGKSLYKVFDDVVQYSAQYTGLQKVVRRAQQAVGQVKVLPSKAWINDPYVSDCITQVSTYWLQCTDSHSPPEPYTMISLERWIHNPGADYEHEATSSAITREVYATHESSPDGVCLADVVVFGRDKQLVDLMLGVRFEQLATGAPNPQANLRGSKSMGLSSKNYGSLRPITLKAAPDRAKATKPPASSKVTNHDSGDDTSSSQKRSKDLKGPEQPSERAESTSSTSTAVQDQHESIGTDADAVVQVLANLSGVDEADINQETELAEIGIDSLLEIELVSDLRKRCGGEVVKIQEWSKVVTVADLVRCIGPTPVAV